MPCCKEAEFLSACLYHCACLTLPPTLLNLDVCANLPLKSIDRNKNYKICVLQMIWRVKQKSWFRIFQENGDGEVVTLFNAYIMIHDKINVFYSVFKWRIGKF